MVFIKLKSWEELEKITQEDDNCYCAICCPGQCTRSSHKLNLTEFTYEETEKVPLKKRKSFCSEYFQIVSPGICHPCNKKTTVQNLHALITSKNQNVVGRVVFCTLKKLSVVGNSKNIKLATEGNTLPVKVYRDRSPIRHIRSKTIISLKINHDLPNCAVLGIIKEIKKDVGKSGIQETTYAEVTNRSRYLDRFYNVKKCQLSSKTFLKKILLIVLTYLCWN